MCLWVKGRRGSAHRCGPGAFYRRMGDVINIPIFHYFTAVNIPESVLLRNGDKRVELVLHG
jgi:hypothetical protein